MTSSIGYRKTRNPQVFRMVLILGFEQYSCFIDFLQLSIVGFSRVFCPFEQEAHDHGLRESARRARRARSRTLEGITYWMDHQHVVERR